MASARIEQVEPDLFTGHRVKIEIFEGPVDLLVYLIKREELDISQIALAQITGQYLEYLQAMQAVSIEVVGEFIVMAATLLQIKSRRLLPATVAEIEAEADDGELVGQMRQRLAQYRTFKEAAQALERSRQLRGHIYVRSLSADSELPSGFVRLEDVSIFDLVGAVRDLLKKADAEETSHTVPRPAVTLQERIEDVLFRLRAAGEQSLTFAELVGTPVTRQIVIVTFLAVLELIRRRCITVHQDRPRAGIVIRPAADGERAADLSVQRS